MQRPGLGDLPAVLSRDPAVGEAYAADPLVYHGGWKVPTLRAFIAADGPVQHKLLAWDPAWAEGLHQTPPNVPVVDPAWFTYAPEPGPLGVYDFRPLVEAARAERAAATTRASR